MKLYWRIKKDGKWTWAPAQIIDHRIEFGEVEYLVKELEEEE